MSKLLEMNVGKYVEQLISEWLVVDSPATGDKDRNRRDIHIEDEPAEKEVKR